MKALTTCVQAAFLAVLAPATLSAQDNVWVVDALNLPGSDFTGLQEAIDAASEGDTILVQGRMGMSYGNSVIAGKSLELAGLLDDLSPALSLNPPELGPVRIQDLLGNQRLTMRGFVIRDEIPVAPLQQSNLTISNCAGLVFIEEVQMDRSPGVAINQPHPPVLDVANSSAVTMVNSSLRGADGLQGSFGGNGAHLTNSTVHMDHVSIDGGTGAPTNLFTPGAQASALPGGEGMRIKGGSFFAFGCRITGGQGGRGVLNATMNCYSSAQGGTGINLRSIVPFSAMMTRIETSVAGGPGGISPGINCLAGPQGDDFEQFGFIQTINAFAHELVVASPVRESEIAVLEFRAQAGDVAFLLLGPLGGPVQDPLAFNGLLHILPIFDIRKMGVIPTSGTLTRQFTIGELGPGVDSASIDLQAFYFRPGALFPDLTASNPTVMLLLDSSF